MKWIWLIALMLVSVVETSVWAGEADSDLYYAAEKSFQRDSKVEVRLGAGYDFSNPYLNVMSFQGGTYWLLDPGLAVGIEGTIFSSSMRGSTQTLKTELGKNGFILDALKPLYRVAGAVRVTPISGLVNFLSSKVIRADVSLIGRVGVVQYETVPIGMLTGIGLETQLGITPQFGIFAGISFDFEKPGNSDWQGRSGFTAGPSWRF